MAQTTLRNHNGENETYLLTYATVNVMDGGLGTFAEQMHQELVFVSHRGRGFNSHLGHKLFTVLE